MIQESKKQSGEDRNGDMLKKWIAGEKQPDEKSLFLWNMIGSSIYSLASLILTYLTIRIIGDTEGGVFAIALTLAQMFIYIAYYEMRNFQVTDNENRYVFSEYHAVKIVNCILMMVVSAGYVFIKQYDLYKAGIILLVCFYRMLDGYADVYEAEFHTKGRLDLAGKSMAFRTVLSVGIYFLILAVSQNLYYALIGAIISGIIGIWIFDLWIFNTVGEIHVLFDRNAIKGILKDCFPLFLGMFLWTYLLSASRIAVDNVLPSQYQSYYQVLFLPVSVINLLAGFLIRPNLIRLTELHAANEKKIFWGIVGKMAGALIAFTVVCMVGAYFCGIPILSLIINYDLSKYRGMFVFLIFAGGFNALAYLLYFVLTIYRNQIQIMVGYGLAAVVALLISTAMVQIWGLWGASFSYLISIFVLIMVFVTCILYEEKKR